MVYFIVMSNNSMEFHAMLWNYRDKIPCIKTKSLLLSALILMILEYVIVLYVESQSVKLPSLMASLVVFIADNNVPM